MEISSNPVISTSPLIPQEAVAQKKPEPETKSCSLLGADTLYLGGAGATFGAIFGGAAFALSGGVFFAVAGIAMHAMDCANPDVSK